MVLTASMPTGQPQSDTGDQQALTYIGCPVTLQNRKVAQFGRANQRWYYDAENGFLRAFNTDQMDKGEIMQFGINCYAAPFSLCGSLYCLTVIIMVIRVDTGSTNKHNETVILLDMVLGNTKVALHDIAALSCSVHPDQSIERTCSIVFLLPEITAANKANVCTFAVMGDTQIDQPVSMSSRLEDRKRSIQPLSSAIQNYVATSCQCSPPPPPFLHKQPEVSHRAA